MKFPYHATNKEKYGPAMLITEQEEANKYFEKLVAHTMEHDIARHRAEKLERINLTAYASTYDLGTQERIKRLFNCV